MAFAANRSSPDSPVCLESLEPRLLLSGNVVVDLHDGILRMIGDRQGNQIQIDQTGLPEGQFRIRGADGTTINGQADDLILEGVQGVRVRLGSGDDILTLQDCQIAGSVEVSLGHGSDEFNLNSGSAANIRILGGSGGNVFDFTNFDSGTVHLRTGGGQDHLTVDDITHLQQLIMNLGGGSDVFELASMPDRATLDGRADRIRGGGGRDSLVGADPAALLTFGKYFRSFAAASESQPAPTDDKTISGIGTVQYNPLEGGFFYIATPAGNFVVDVPDEFQTSGRVRYVLEPHPEWLSTVMWGTPARLISIQDVGDIYGGVGTVTWQDFEGGFWGIRSDQGAFDVAVPPEFQHEGMQVHFQVEELRGVASFHMWGRVARLISMEAVSESTETPVPFQTLSHQYWTRFTSPWGAVARTANEFRSLGQLFLPSGFGFSQYMVIAVFAGEFSSGGYSIDVTSVTETDDQIIVHTVTRHPSPDAGVTCALTQPCALVSIPQSGKTVVFADLPNTQGSTQPDPIVSFDSLP